MAKLDFAMQYSGGRCPCQALFSRGWMCYHGGVNWIWHLLGERTC